MMTILYLGGTPLHISAGRGYGAIVKELLDNGADINSEDSDGEYRVYQF